MFDIVIRKNDTLPIIARKVYLDGSAVDLTGYAMKFRVSDTAGTQIFENNATLTGASAINEVKYQWTAADSDLVSGGVYFALFKGTKASDVLTFPNNKPMSLMVTDTSKHEYSYSGDPSKRPIDKVRFLIRDTDMSKSFFTDSEIEFMIAEWGDAYSAAVFAAESQSGFYATLSDKTVGPLSIRYGDQSKRWSDLAAALRRRSARSSGAKAINGNVVRDPLFKIGMHDTDNGADLLLGEETP